MKKEELDIDNSLVIDQDEPKLVIEEEITNNINSESNENSPEPAPEKYNLKEMACNLYSNGIQKLSLVKTWVQDKQNISDTLESSKHFSIGFCLGLFFNVLGYGFLNKMKRKNKKKNGFAVGCVFSFLFYIFFCVTVMSYLTSVRSQRHKYALAHKNSVKKFHASNFSLFLTGYLGRTRNKLSNLIFFWRKKPIVKNKQVSKREIQIQKMKRKRLSTINKLRNSFKSRYNFS
jgi:hypothetical protein